MVTCPLLVPRSSLQYYHAILALVVHWRRTWLETTTRRSDATGLGACVHYLCVCVNFSNRASACLCYGGVPHVLRSEPIINRWLNCVVLGLALMFERGWGGERRRQRTAGHDRGNGNPEAVTTYLNVPFPEKAEAKARGARWDSEAKKSPDRQLSGCARCRRDL